MTNDWTRNISRAALAALMLFIATAGAPAAAQGKDPISAVWLLNIDGSAPVPATFATSGSIILAGGMTLPQNACTSGAVGLGDGHGQWGFRRQNHRLRWTTVNTLKGQEVLPYVEIRVSGVVQQGPTGPVFSGNGVIATYPDANALLAGTPTCTTQVTVNGFTLSDEGDLL